MLSFLHGENSQPIHTNTRHPLEALIPYLIILLLTLTITATSNLSPNKVLLLKYIILNSHPNLKQHKTFQLILHY